MNVNRGLWLLLIVAVIGLTAEASALNPRSVPPGRSAGIPNHILTWGYDGGNGGQTDGSSAARTNYSSKAHIQTWLNFAEGSALTGRLSKNGEDCAPDSSCTPIVYFEPTRMRVNPIGGCGDAKSWDWYSQATESQFKHYPNPAPGVDPMSPANRIMSRTNLQCKGGYEIMFFPNLSDLGYQAFWRQKLQQYRADGDYTEFFADSFGSMVEDDAFAGTGNPGGSLKGSYEVRDRETAETHHKTFAAAMRWQDGAPMKLFGNAAVQVLGSAKGMPHLALLDQANIVGGICEGCITTGSRVNSGNVGSVLNLIADVQAYYPKAYFVLNGRSTAPAGSTDSCASAGNGCGQIPARLFQLAVIWLGFSQNIVDWSNFANRAPTLLAVYPEQSIFPSVPVHNMGPSTAVGENGSGCAGNTFDRSQAGGAKDLVVSCGQLWNGKAAGVYVREFRKCYNFGQLIGHGQCAVILNTTSLPITASSNWKYVNGSPAFTQGYTNALSVSGGDVLTAGCGNSRCPSSALNPFGASFGLDSTAIPANAALFVFHS